jgi:hypothetical protein
MPAFKKGDTVRLINDPSRFQSRAVKMMAENGIPAEVILVWGPTGPNVPLTYLCRFPAAQKGRPLLAELRADDLVRVRPFAVIEGMVA